MPLRCHNLGMKMLCVFVACTILSISTSSLSAQEIEEAPPTEIPGATISGQAIIELKVGVKQYLKAMEIALIPESKAERLKEIRDKRWLEQASRVQFDAGYYYLDLNAIGYFAVENAVARAKTDDKGNFQFTGISPGKFRIYAQYKSRYAAGYWLIPVEVASPDDSITRDINNDSLEEIYNREIR